MILFSSVHPDDYVATEDEPWTMAAKMHSVSENRKVKRVKPWCKNWGHKLPQLGNVDNPHQPMFYEGDRVSFLDAILAECRKCTTQCTQVEVLVGKDRGKQGIIAEINRELNCCYVTGLNCVSFEIIGYFN